MYNALDAMVDYADASLGFSREVSCFALPLANKALNEVISITSNDSAGSVEFDWFTIKDAVWNLRKTNEVKAAYMLHTHPMGFNRMSTIDRNMVHGWCIALGIPIWFLVVTEEEIATYLCSLNQETKKVEKDLLDLSKHEDACIDLRIVSELMYGLSKCPTSNFTYNSLNKVLDTINESGIRFEYIHSWNETRKWNQICIEEYDVTESSEDQSKVGIFDLTQDNPT